MKDIKITKENNEIKFTIEFDYVDLKDGDKTLGKVKNIQETIFPDIAEAKKYVEGMVAGPKQNLEVMKSNLEKLNFKPELFEDIAKELQTKQIVSKPKLKELNNLLTDYKSYQNYTAGVKYWQGVYDTVLPFALKLEEFEKQNK